MADNNSSSFVKLARSEEVKFEFRYDCGDNSLTIVAVDYSTYQEFMTVFKPKISFHWSKVQEAIDERVQYAKGISLGEPFFDVSLGFMIFTLKPRIETGVEKVAEFSQLKKTKFQLEWRIKELEKKIANPDYQPEETTGLWITAHLLDSLPVSQAPSAEAQKNAFQALADCEMNEGDSWFLIDSRWWSQWTQYISDSEEKNAPPRPINNENLLHSDGSLRSKISRDDSSYHLVDKNQWKLLRSWYGGGPVIERRIIHTNSQLEVEINPIRLNFKLYSDDNVKVRTLCSRGLTTRELKDLGMAEFGLSEKGTRMLGDNSYHGWTEYIAGSRKIQTCLCNDSEITFVERLKNGKRPKFKVNREY